MRRRVLASLLIGLVLAFGSSVSSQNVGPASGQFSSGLPKALQGELALPGQRRGPIVGLADGPVITGLSLPSDNIVFQPGGLAAAVAASNIRLGPDPTTQIPIRPSTGEAILVADRLRLATACGAGGPSCGLLPRYDVAIASLKRGQLQFGGCSGATAAFLRSYPGPSAPDVAAAYDIACLGSVEPRGQEAPFLRDGLPAELAALSSPHGKTPIALLEVAGKPFCGALLRNDRTLVTARHCIDDAQAAWDAGLLTIRPIDGRGGPWKVAPGILQPEGAVTASVGDDWAVLRIETTDAIEATPVSLKSALGPGPVSIVGYFKQHAAVGYGPGQSPAEWKRGLRWPRPGFCQIQEVRANCLRLLCQTVEGFSGAPIFDATTPTPTVVGFISRPASSSTGRCGSTQIASITLAASAAVIR